MRLERLRTFALAQPRTTVVKQWGGQIFKVVDKVFLMLILDGEVLSSVIFKCTPEEFDQLTEIDGIGQAPYCAKRMWVKVEDLAVLPEKELLVRIRHSYDLVAAKLPKKVQATLK
jgi:predicted DNA-binding protein (MmcQ/YjbR family)